MEPKDTHSLPPILVPIEFFKFMRIGHTAGYDALRRGEFPFAIRVGRQWRIPRDAMLRYLGQEKAAEAGDQAAAGDGERREARNGR